MLFEIKHRTAYAYGHPAAEAYLEARLHPPDRPGQRVIRRDLLIDPVVELSPYTDPFGNRVEFFAISRRHKALSLEIRMLVETWHAPPPTESLEVSVQEARQIFASQLVDLFPWMQLTEVVDSGRDAARWARRFFTSGNSIGEACLALNEAVHREFRYQAGATDNSTTLSEVWREKKGVCQDFAHITLSILRTARIPARYVCGYIETDPPKDGSRALVGSIATHAWVEVLLPGGPWLGIDPTNNQTTGERHVAMAFGRDFRDAAPVRGTFKGAGRQTMKVTVSMKRRRQNKIGP